ncbi:MAG: hypothetical protein C0412_13975, partial [Flavobacterium sp.]|nr:hypothetical protein [Flavobacterium sp.]
MKIKINIICIILFLLAVAEFAQNKKLEFEQKSPDKLVNSRNNLPLIIITSKLDLLFQDQDRFTGEKNVEKKKFGSINEYKLFVVVDEKTVLLKITAEGFDESLTIEVNELAPKQVKMFHVFEKVNYGITELGDFFLASSPEGAKISIRGQPKFSEMTPFDFKDYTATTYKLTLEKEDYYKVDTTIAIQKENKQSLKVNLRAKFGYLKVNTDRDYQLFIDGSETSYNTPIKINEGIRNIEVKKKYFKDLVDKIEVEGKYDPMIIEKKYVLEPYYGKLNVRSNIYGATVLLNGEEVGTTTFERVIAAGKYNLEIKKDKYRTEKFQLEILRDEAKDTLVELKQYGTLKIVGPNAASITLINGGYEKKLANDNLYELPPGDYNIKVELDGYDTYEDSFYLDTEFKTIEIDLIKTEGRFLRFTAFDINSRLYQITPSAYWFITYNPKTINPNFLSTAAKYPFYNPAKNTLLLGGGLNIVALPYTLEFEVGFFSLINSKNISGSETLTNYTDSTMFDLYTIKTKIGYCPFVLFER